MFYKLSWNAQLLAAIGLFVIALAIEAEVFAALLHSGWLAIGLAAGLEVSKALSIVLARAYHSSGEHVPSSVATLTVVFRVGLILLSGLCANLYLAQHMDRPQLEQVRAHDLALAEKHYRDQVQQLDLQTQQARDLARASNRERHATIASALSQQRTTRAEAKQLPWTLARSESDSLSRDMARIDAEAQARRRSLDAEFEGRSRAIRQARYDHDERVDHPMVRAFLGLLASVTGWQMTSLELCFWLSLLVAAMLELAIYIGFEHLTVAYRHVFALGDGVRQRGDAMDAAMQQFEQDQDQVLRKARKTADRIDAEAQTLLRAA